MTRFKRNETTVNSAFRMVDALKLSIASEVKPLPYCNAYYYNTFVYGERYCVLVSRGTIVAYYHYGSGAFKDILRVVTGYAPISAIHISIFKNMFDIKSDIRYI